MPRTPYYISVTGDPKDRMTLSGILVNLSANLSNHFFLKDKSVVFLFRYKSDARLVLKKMLRAGVNAVRIGPDDLVCGNASATIRKRS